jgi:ferric-dicitrate binding protein FerR (iron transport regulator)
MEQHQIRTFLEKFIAGTSIEEEHQQFNAWLRIAPIEEVEAIAEEYKTIYELKGLNHADPELIEKIELALDQNELESNSFTMREDDLPTKGKVLHIGRRWAVAASIIFLIATSVFIGLIIKSKGTDENIVDQPAVLDKNAPASNRAMITLVDGSKVYLDSAGSGQLAMQGKVHLIKTADGKIVYRPDVKEQSEELIYNTITNPRGSKVVDMTFADGSRVWLNAGSSVTFPVAFTTNERKVSITGEAYFEVAKDPLKQFIVDANGITTKVLGTHFNINSFSDEENIKVTLLEGSLKVSNSKDEVLIKPGEQVISKEQLTINKNADLEDVMAWKNGYFYFENADLKTILRQFARWYDIEVGYEGSIPKREFAGKIQRDLNLSQVLKVLEKSGVHFKLENNKLIVLP